MTTLADLARAALGRLGPETSAGARPKFRLTRGPAARGVRQPRKLGAPRRGGFLGGSGARRRRRTSCLAAGRRSVALPGSISTPAAIPTPAIAPWAQEVIDRFDSYTEVSPSGTGVKIFFHIATRRHGGRGSHLRRPQAAGSSSAPAATTRPRSRSIRGGRYFGATDESIGPRGSAAGRPRRLPMAHYVAGPRFAGEARAKNKRTAKTRAARRRAFRAGAALKAAGATYEEMRDALLGSGDPDIAEWARTKGSPTASASCTASTTKPAMTSPRCGWRISSPSCSRTITCSCPLATSGRRLGSMPGCRRSSCSTRTACRSSTRRRASKWRCRRAPGSPSMRQSSR